MSKMKVSLVVITKNEEKNIEKCIKSVPFADEVIVVDSGSTDKTKEIVESLGGKFIYNPWPGFGRQKQFAIEQAKNNWLVLLDADEYLSEKCQQEIITILKTEPKFSGYRIPRQQIFMGKECYYGKSVDYPLRLVDRSQGAYDLKNIHESFISHGEISTLKYPMTHNSGITVFDRCKKIMRDLELELENNNFPNLTVWNITIDPIRYFLSYYFKRKAFKDGLPGFVMTALFSIQVFLQNAAQYEKNLVISHKKTSV